MTELEHFRHQKDDFFKHSQQSPLTPEQQASFEGLNYFDENPDLRFETEVERFPDGEQIQIQTNTGDVQTYERYGRFEFEVEGQNAQLTVFRNENGFFLPFADSQAGTETYGAGRYLEPEPAGGGRLYIDFNLAYNPYCAYNANWSCPITPAENRIKVPVRAGEKVFDDHE
jgi:uncharacterized protein (DUF1684 family)